MNRGKWCLVYTYTDEMEDGMFRTGRMEVEIPLRATTEDEAVAEANERWRGISSKALARWEEQRGKWKNPPASSPGGPRNPRVIYKISLP